MKVVPFVTYLNTKYIFLNKFFRVLGFVRIQDNEISLDGANV